MVSWSEVSQRGARSAIHCNARFSMEAVSDWFTRLAARNSAAPFVVADSAFMFGSFLFISCCYSDGFGPLRSALHAERRVNSSDSRGMLSTTGPIAHPSPVGTERVRDTDSIC